MIGVKKNKAFENSSEDIELNSVEGQAFGGECDLDNEGSRPQKSKYSSTSRWFKSPWITIGNIALFVASAAMLATSAYMIYFNPACGSVVISDGTGTNSTFSPDRLCTLESSCNNGTTEFFKDCLDFSDALNPNFDRMVATGELNFFDRAELKKIINGSTGYWMGRLKEKTFDFMTHVIGTFGRYEEISYGNRTSTGEIVRSHTVYLNSSELANSRRC